MVKLVKHVSVVQCVHFQNNLPIVHTFRLRKTSYHNSFVSTRKLSPYFTSQNRMDIYAIDYESSTDKWAQEPELVGNV